MPVVEPVLPILDEWARGVVINACYVQKMNDGKPVFDEAGDPVIICRYHDILLLASTGLGHLEGISHFTWEQGMSFLFDWEGFSLDPLIDKYWREPTALNALYAIKSCMTRAIIGGSIEGASQNFLVRYRGADRSIQITRGEESKK